MSFVCFVTVLRREKLLTATSQSQGKVGDLSRNQTSHPTNGLNILRKKAFADFKENRK